MALYGGKHPPLSTTLEVRAGRSRYFKGICFRTLVCPSISHAAFLIRTLPCPLQIHRFIRDLALNLCRFARRASRQARRVALQIFNLGPRNLLPKLQCRQLTDRETLLSKADSAAKRWTNKAKTRIMKGAAAYARSHEEHHT